MRQMSTPAIICTITIFVLILLSLIVATYYYRRHKRLHSHKLPNSFPTNISKSPTSSPNPPPSTLHLSTRNQTHADRKVFSWFFKVADTDIDASAEGGDRDGDAWRRRSTRKTSVWSLSAEEMLDLEAAIERLRGRESCISCSG